MELNARGRRLRQFLGSQSLVGIGFVAVGMYRQGYRLLPMMNERQRQLGLLHEECCVSCTQAAAAV